MTRKEKIDYLSQYKDVEMEIDQLEDELYAIRCRATRITQTYSGMPGGGGDGRLIENVLAQYDAKLKEIERKMNDAKCLRSGISSAIDSLCDSTQKLVMRCRYMYGMKWYQISSNTNYCRMQLSRIHENALDNMRM